MKISKWFELLLNHYEQYEICLGFRGHWECGTGVVILLSEEGAYITFKYIRSTGNWV